MRRALFRVQGRVNSFDELNLSPTLQRAIKELGYEKPSPIQAEALPLLMAAPTDFIGLAATGTGKTAAFALPMLERIDIKQKHVQALILCPTRELAKQVGDQINLLGKYHGARALMVYGGSSYGDQLHGLKHGSTVVVGTPGRIIDHIERGTLDLSALRTLILDEADEMISMGFKDELEKILQTVPKDSSNIWLFSATMSREVRRVADTYLRNPKQVQVNKKDMLSENVEQYYYVSQEANKPEILCKLIDAAEDFYGLIFCQTKALVNDLSDYLTARGYKVDSLHGDKDQRSRERTLQTFRDKQVQMLICTDVAARGIDVKGVSHVVNYSLPRELDSYVHRIGRTARSGKSGVAMSLVTPANRRLVERIEVMTKTRMQQGKIPSGRDIGVKKVLGFLPKFTGQAADQAKFARIQALVDETWLAAVKEMPKEEILARFLTLLLPDVASEPEKTKFSSFDAGPSRPPRRFDGPRDGHRDAPRGERRDRFRKGPSDGPRPAFRKGPRPPFKSKTRAPA